jgi:steroid 5-alpha reductase family enzyme
MKKAINRAFTTVYVLFLVFAFWLYLRTRNGDMSDIQAVWGTCKCLLFVLFATSSVAYLLAKW